MHRVCQPLEAGANNAQTIKRFAITSANDAPARDPKNWEFQGSNDGATWTTLDSRNGQSSSRIAARRPSTMSPVPVPYRWLLPAERDREQRRLQHPAGPE
jgi:hypothetical protein